MALKELAVGDFEEAMSVRNFVTRRFPQLSIQLYATETVIQRKYVVWGLVLAIHNMVVHQTFQHSFALLYWKGEDIGAISFGPTPITSTVLDTQAHVGVTVPPKLVGPPSSEAAHRLQPKGDDTAAIPVAANRVTVDFAYIGSNIGLETIFMTIISALSEAATRSAASRLDGPWSSQFEGWPCHFVTKPVSPTRRTPPVYEWRWLIQVLGQATEYMVGRSDYRNLQMDIKVDGVRVGMASLIDDDDGIRV
ncbi:MAG: hypothetical protein Q9182_006665 [Xanthomendoza sp. 2 TL-2023]